VEISGGLRVGMGWGGRVGVGVGWGGAGGWVGGAGWEHVYCIICAYNSVVNATR
jgi:hypothetical protein